MIKNNLIANFIAGFWTAILGLIFTPFYIRILGPENYGVIGIYTSLQAIFVIFDLGLSQTLSREVAIHSAQNNKAAIADTVKTLEIIYWVIAFIVFSIMLMLSYVIAYHWLNPSGISRGDLMHVFYIMSIAVGLRLPIALYIGGLNGLQKQVVLNVIIATFATIQGVGCILVLCYVNSSIFTFFIWLVLVSLFQVIFLKITLIQSIKSKTRGVFRGEIIKNVWRFATGMTGITLISTILMQSDKIILSKLLPLDQFGYYTFAAMIAAIIGRAVAPIFTVYYPRFTELVSKNEIILLIRNYHLSSQLMILAVIPLSLTLVFFSKELISVWVNDPKIVINTYPIVILLVIGNALNGIMNIPYALQLAYGWTELAFYMNVAALVFQIPALIYSINQWGALGAAIVWIILNCSYIFIGIQLMHRKLIPNQKMIWYLNDNLKPVIVAIGIIVLGSLFVTYRNTLLLNLSLIIIIFLLMSVGVVLTSTALRYEILKWSKTSKIIERFYQ